MGVISCREKMLTEHTPFLHLNFFVNVGLYVFYRTSKAFNEVIY